MRLSSSAGLYDDDDDDDDPFDRGLVHVEAVGSHPADGNHLDPADAATERARLTAVMTDVLTAIGSTDAVEIADVDASRRWDEVRAIIDVGRSVTLLREGQPWAIISPHPPQRHP